MLLFIPLSGANNTNVNTAFEANTTKFAIYWNPNSGINSLSPELSESGPDWFSHQSIQLSAIWKRPIDLYYILLTNIFIQLLILSVKVIIVFKLIYFLVNRCMFNNYLSYMFQPKSFSSMCVFTLALWAFSQPSLPCSSRPSILEHPSGNLKVHWLAITQVTHYYCFIMRVFEIYDKWKKHMN